MFTRLAILLLTLGLAYQPVSAQAASFQTTDPDAAQARDDKAGDEEEKDSNYLIPGAVVGSGLVAGSFATGMWEADALPAMDEGGTDNIPAVTVPSADPVPVTGGVSATSHVTVPEPGTLGLLAVGVFGLIGVTLFRRSRTAA